MKAGADAMIVIDASIFAPLVLNNEPSPPGPVLSALLSGRLIAPGHWPLEVANILLSAFRRRRLDRPGWNLALEYVRDLGVLVEDRLDVARIGGVSALADSEALTIYDALYLQLAIERSAVLATLDDALLKAAARRSVPVLSY